MTIFDRILYDAMRASMMKATRASYEIAVLLLYFNTNNKKNKNTGGASELI